MLKTWRSFAFNAAKWKRWRKNPMPYFANTKFAAKRYTRSEPPRNYVRSTLHRNKNVESVAKAPRATATNTTKNALAKLCVNFVNSDGERNAVVSAAANLIPNLPADDGGSEDGHGENRNPDPHGVLLSGVPGSVPVSVAATVSVSVPATVPASMV